MASKKVEDESNYHTVKVRVDSYETLKRVKMRVSQEGWAALGVTRDEPPHLTALLEVAIGLLAERLKQR